MWKRQFSSSIGMSMAVSYFFASLALRQTHPCTTGSPTRTPPGPVLHLNVVLCCVWCRVCARACAVVAGNNIKIAPSLLPLETFEESESAQLEALALLDDQQRSELCRMLSGAPSPHPLPLHHPTL
jgi:hypothetical protein